MPFCEFCGAEVRFNFCPKCGKPVEMVENRNVSLEKEQNPPKGRERVKGGRFCQTCGKKVEKGYCNECEKFVNNRISSKIGFSLSAAGYFLLSFTYLITMFMLIFQSTNPFFLILTILFELLGLSVIAIGLGGLLSSQTDYDIEHRKKIILAFILIILFPVIFLLDIGIFLLTDSIFVMVFFYVLAFSSLGLGNFISYFHLSKEKYFGNPTPSIKVTAIIALIMNFLISFIMIIISISGRTGANEGMSVESAEALLIFFLLIVIAYFVMQGVPYLLVLIKIIQTQKIITPSMIDENIHKSSNKTDIKEFKIKKPLEDEPLPSFITNYGKTVEKEPEKEATFPTFIDRSGEQDPETNIERGPPQEEKRELTYEELLENNRSEMQKEEKGSGLFFYDPEEEKRKKRGKKEKVEIEKDPRNSDLERKYLSER